MRRGGWSELAAAGDRCLSCRRRSEWPRDHRPHPSATWKRAKRAWLAPRRQLGTFAGLLALCLILWAATPHFLTVSNLLNVLEQTALNAIVAMGMTFVIISGGIDLSVGSVLAFAGIGLALALEHSVPAPAAIVIALAMGGCGLVNSLLITLGRLRRSSRPSA